MSRRSLRPTAGDLSGSTRLKVPNLVPLIKVRHQHGYDITDHNKLNTAIGTRKEYDAFVAEPLNYWWMDVLENGPSSIYAPYLDTLLG